MSDLNKTQKNTKKN